MKTSPRILCALATLALLSGCVSAKQIEPVPSEPLTLTVGKFFSITKTKPWYKISCKITVAPAKGDVKVRRGSTVAWVMGNDCDDAADVRLRFFRKGRGKATEEYPIKFEPMRNNVLYGTVIDDGGTEEATYEYTAIVGRHQKDPEIIVF